MNPSVKKEARKDAEPIVPAKLAIIRSLLQAGRVLVPARGKSPTVSDWPNTKFGQYDELALLEDNYGIVIQDGELVLDVDPRNFTPGDNPLDRFLKDTGQDITNAYIVGTGGGGLHVHLTMPKGVLVRNSLEAYRGLEFKGLGRQVIAAGSIHPQTGKPYTVRRGNPSVTVEINQAALQMISRIATPFSEVGVKAWINDAATQGRYLAYLQDTAKPSIEGQGGDNNAFVVAATGRDMGLPPGLTFDLMLEVWNKRCKPEWAPEELRVKVVNAYKFAAGVAGADSPQAQFEKIETPAKEEDISWDMTPQKQMRKTFNNLLTYLRSPNHGLKNVFAYNEFTQQVEFINPAPWHRGLLPRYPAVQDHDLKMLKGYLAKRHSFEMPVAALDEAIVVTAHAAKFHPVREYLESLTWDGKYRLDHWLTDYLGVKDSPYVRAIARKTICAAIMRVMKPGIKFDHVLVLEGEEGVGKSTVIKILGGKWSGDFQVDPHKIADTVQLMQGKWFVELAELASIKGADSDAVKAFFSRDTDKARLAYGRLASEFPRQCIFIGSYNPRADEAYLPDEATNRRWWPVRCAPKGGRVDFSAFKEVRNQLFAEAAHIVKTRGEKLYMDTVELQTEAKEEAAHRRAEHPWTERLNQWISIIMQKPETRRDFITARDAYVDAMGGIDKTFDRRVQLSVARAMRECGWVPKVNWVDGRPCRGYVRKSPTTKSEEKESLDLLASIR